MWAAKIGTFWYKSAPKWYIPLSNFYQIWHGEGTPRPAPSCQINLIIVTLKCGLTASKITEVGNFWYKFAEKGYTPLHDFYKMWIGEGVPGMHLHAKFHCLA